MSKKKKILKSIKEKFNGIFRFNFSVFPFEQFLILNLNFNFIKSVSLVYLVDTRTGIPFYSHPFTLLYTNTKYYSHFFP